MSVVKLRNKFILAFPGMGKTPLAKKNPLYRDLDFGTMRVGLGFQKEDDAKLAPIYSKYLSALDQDVLGVTFMGNDPILLDYVRVDHVYLPIHPTYSARKLGVSTAQVIEWVSSWEEQAKKHNVPVTYVAGLDKYLGNRP